MQFHQLCYSVVDCGMLSAPENGLLSTENTTFGSLVIYSCIEGYNIMGDEMRMCLENGSWSRHDPVCQGECMCVCSSLLSAWPTGSISSKRQGWTQIQTPMKENFFLHGLIVIKLANPITAVI